MGELTRWLDRQIRMRIYLAQNAVELGTSQVWMEQSSGVLLISGGDEGDALHGIVTADSTETLLMEANDPRDTIARCTAELAILDEHHLVVADHGAPEQGQSSWRGYRVLRDRIPEDQEEEARQYASMMWACLECKACRQRPPCKTVRLLASAYRHEDGYDPQWEKK